MSEATRFPLDFDALDRGSVIGPEVIEGWHGHKPETTAFRLDQMTLAQKIREHFRSVRGDTVSVRCFGNGLAILTHQQQNEYVPRAQKSALRMFARRHLEDQGIDASQLTSEEQARRDDRLRKSSWLLQQARRPASSLPPMKGPDRLGDGTEEEGTT